MPLLHPSQRKSFTITKDTALYLASKLADGRKLTFQSSANRNWVAKLARTRYGVETEVYVSRNQLLDPRYTVEGQDMPDNGIYNEKHWMNVYCAEATQPAFIKPPTQDYRTLIARPYNRREDYVR